MRHPRKTTVSACFNIDARETDGVFLEVYATFRVTTGYEGNYSCRAETPDEYYGECGELDVVESVEIEGVFDKDFTPVDLSAWELEVADRYVVSWIYQNTSVVLGRVSPFDDECYF